MKTWMIALSMAAAVALPGSSVRAADHKDGTAVQMGDPAVDINDVYSWVSSPDGAKIYLAMTVFPMASTGASFSTAAVYVFHTASRASLSAMQQTSIDIPCTFDAMKRITCWVPQAGGSPIVVGGDAGATGTGISDPTGRVKVYAGLRKDHFFFNLAGFDRARNLAKSAATSSMLTFDTTNCLTGQAGPRTGILSALGQNAGGTTPPVDAFRMANTLAIVLEVDKTLLNKGGNILSVWAATRAK